MGAWIEIAYIGIPNGEDRVAPLVGAWIEIDKEIGLNILSFCRSPCGSVD